MALDEKYLTGFDLNQVFVNKDTGEPLSGGKIYFFRDSARGTSKLAYQLTSTLGVYSYVALPNPITLSAAGTIANDDGDNVALYYYPYEGLPAADSSILDLYFVQVKSSAGVEQFTREAWPTISGSNNPIEEPAGFSNEVSNSQFVDLFFDTTAAHVIAFTGAATTTVGIGPDWDLVISHSDNGSVSVTRTAIAGSLKLPNNPPYTLSITGHAQVTAMSLRQRFNNNPDIWAPAVAGVGGYVASSVLLGNGSSVTMNYITSNAVTKELLSDTNASGVFAEFNATVQLDPGANPGAPSSGYVDLSIDVDILGTTVLSNVQVIGMNSDNQDVPYEQLPVNRQEDHLYHYYKDAIFGKRIPSYLIGWDFALNPAQALGATVAASAIGANKSKYVWDQTIMFQTEDSAIGVTRSAEGSIVLTAAIASKTALVQYLDQDEARALLAGDLSVNVRAKSDSVTTVTGNVSLYWTTAATLPVVTAGTNDSLVLSLDAAGKPATFNLAWNEVARTNRGDANLALTTGLRDYGFDNWDDTVVGAGDTTATYFAIVVGFSEIDIAKTVTVESISLVPGSIPCRPGVQTKATVLAECQKYYEKSFDLDVVPAQAVGANTGEHSVINDVAASSFQMLGTSLYKVTKRNTVAKPTVVTYNPIAANIQARNVLQAADCTLTTVLINQFSGFTLRAQVAAGSILNNQYLSVHWTSDSRIGIVT